MSRSYFVVQVSVLLALTRVAARPPPGHAGGVHGAAEHENSGAPWRMP
jgi:hypothetical protein